MSQMTQMGTDPLRLGPPEAASGIAGGDGGRQHRAIQKGATLAPPMEPRLAKRPPKTASVPFFNLCESPDNACAVGDLPLCNLWNLWNLWIYVSFCAICFICDFPLFRLRVSHQQQLSPG